MDSHKPAGDSIEQVAESLFRHEAGRLVSILTGIFGIDRLQLAEDVVQEALVRALQTWPYYGIPENPAGWLMQTARNLALDVLRREKRFRDKQQDISDTLAEWAHGISAESPHLEQEVADDQLRMMFACCHPELPPEAQTALALRTLAGFSPAEIARAFLTTEAAIAKRLVRARQRLREPDVRFEIPSGDDLPPRLLTVQQTIYLLFNEGYKATSGNHVIREELCREAIRLGKLLAEHPVVGTPTSRALLALMLLHGSRLKARLDGSGQILRLDQQDRGQWNQQMIMEGLSQLGLASTGTEVSSYHLQAAIAAYHSTAGSFDATNWAAILELYDKLMEQDRSPIVALNRAVALARVDGPEAGIKAIASIADRAALKDYYLFDAVLGDLQEQAGNFARAAEHFGRARELTDLPGEKDFLQQRQEACLAQGAAGAGGA